MAGKGAKTSTDRRFVLWLVGAVVVAVLLFALFGPRADTNDPEPTSTNASSRGVKAAFLLLPRLGYGVDRWTEPATHLDRLDAAKTTLVITNPDLPFRDLEVVQKALKQFMERGGRVIATGETGARLLPDGTVGSPTGVLKQYCETTGEGAGALSRPEGVQMEEPSRWITEGPLYRVRQRCGKDAVVVEYPVGRGTAIWWAQPTPMTNRGLKQDASLELVLASIGPVSAGDGGTRTVLFDEWLHSEHETVGSALTGLPWWPLTWQLVGVAVLLVLSLGRRNGPLRMPATMTRTSPIEFAQSMGRLYEKAGATEAATGAAESRLKQYLHQSGGLPRETLRGTPETIGEALRARFGGDWTELERDLHYADADGRRAGGKERRVGGKERMGAKAALKLVQRLEADRQGVAAVIESGRVQRNNGNKEGRTDG